MSNSSVSAPTAVLCAAGQRCSLILPVGPSLAADDLVAAVEVLVRTAPAEVELRLVLAVDPGLAERSPATSTSVDALSGDVDVVRGSLAEAAATADELIAVLDAVVRPDLADLVPLLARLERADDPLPFVHRLGILLTRRSALTHVPAGVPSALPALARALRPEPVAPSFRPSLPTDVEPAAVHSPGSVSIVLVADATLDVLDPCLARLQHHLPTGAEVVLVDPGNDGSRTRALRTLRWARVLPAQGGHPLGTGIAAATGEIVVLLDPATWVTRHSLSALVDAVRRDPGVVAAGPWTNLGLGHQQASEVGYADVEGMEAFARSVRQRNGNSLSEVDALVPACLSIRRSSLLAVGGTDESFRDPQIAGIDLSLRLRAAGGRLVRVDGAFVHVADLPRGAGRGRWRLGGGGELGALRARHGADADRALPGLLGVVMIVKNEEETLARALESVSGVVDDVVVCDTGSTDGTLDLIDACGARRTGYAWTQDFAAARNAALAAHTGTWGLLLDADETLECADPRTWRHWLARNASDVGFLVCRNLESGTAGSIVDNASARLLRAADCHWTGRIHEQMVRRDGTPARNSASDGARIIHDGYSLRKVVDRKKIDRNGELTRLEFGPESPSVALAAATGSLSPRLLSPRLDAEPPNESGRVLFERGRAEMLAGRKEVAETYFRRAVELLPEHSELLRRMAYCNLASLANENGRYGDARDFAQRAIDDERHYTQAALALAVAELELDGPDARATALRLLEATIGAGRTAGENPSIGRLLHSLRDEGLVYGAVASLLGGLLLEAGESARVVAVLLPLAQARPSLFEAWPVLRSALADEQQNWAEILAAAAASDPGVLGPLTERLSDGQRAELFAALRRRGIEDWQVSETERTWRALQPELRRMSGAALVAAARQQEAANPELALRLWRYAGDAPYMRVGQARCLDAMDRPEEAAEALDGLDPDGLDPADTLFVAALAAQLGDAALALALLDGLPAALDESLAGPSREMRELLTSG